MLFLISLPRARSKKTVRRPAGTDKTSLSIVSIPPTEKLWTLSAIKLQLGILTGVLEFRLLRGQLSAPEKGLECEALFKDLRCFDGGREAPGMQLSPEDVAPGPRLVGLGFTLGASIITIIILGGSLL